MKIKKKHKKGFFIVSSVFISIQVALPAWSLDVSSVTAVGSSELDVLDNTVIVQYEAGTTPHGSYAHEYISDAVDGDASVDTWKLTVSDNTPLDEVVSELEQDSTVQNAELLPVRRMALTVPHEDSDEYAYQWHHWDTYGVQSETAWDSQTGSSDIVVAVIDSGVDLDHPDIADNIWTNTGEIADNGIDDDGNGYVDDIHGYDFIDEDGDPTPQPNGVDDDEYIGADSGVLHGTHVAGIIGAQGNNGVGVAGMMWNVQIMAVQVLDDEGYGYDDQIAPGVRYAVDNGADVINLSLGSEYSTDILENAIEYAVENGVVVVAALGNDSSNVNTEPFYPACYNGVFGVTATTYEGAAADFTNYGTDCADIAAPGEYIYATYFAGVPEYDFDTEYGYLSGTSMATPVVAGIAGLVLSEDSSLSGTAVKNIITSTADDIGLSSVYGSGLANAADAVSAASNSGDEEVEEGVPTRPTITAWDSSSQNESYSTGERYNDTVPYFSWTESEDEDGVSGYYVYFGTSSTADPLDAAFQTSTTYTPAELSGGNNQSYFLRIKAVDGLGTTSATATFEYVYDTEVSAPTGVQVTNASNGAKITWNKVDDNVVRYKIYRKKKGKKNFTFVKNRGASKKQYIDKNIKPGNTYIYKVRSVDDFGNKNTSGTKKLTFRPRDRAVMAPGIGGAPQVRVYNLKKNEYEQTWFAFDPAERGGAELAVGQLEKDKKEEVVATRAVGAPHVRVFDANGSLKKEFLAYDAAFQGGVRVAVGDFDNDGRDEIATIPGPGAVPQVKLWEANGTFIGGFSALDGLFTGGAYIAALDWNGDGKDEIAIAPDAGGGRRIYIYNRSGALVTFIDAYTDGFNSGMRIAGANFGQQRDRLVAVPVDGTTFVQIFRKSGSSATELQPGFFAYDRAGYTDGGTVAAGDLSLKGVDRLLVGTNDSSWIGTVLVYKQNGSSYVKRLEPFGSLGVPVNIASGWVY